MRALRRASVLLVVMIAAGCERGLIAAPGMEEFEPPASYVELHAEVAACVGIQAPFERIRWYSAERVTTEDGDRAGYWRPPHDVILSEFSVTRHIGTEFELHGLAEHVVAHEIVHDLLGEGNRAHADPRMARCDRREAYGGAS